MSNQLKKIGRKYQETALIKLIAVGLVIGIILAVAAPQTVPVIAIFGDLFVRALKGVAPILVFVLVMNAMAQKNADASASMRPIVKLYVIATFLASLVAVGFSFAFPTSLQLQMADAKLAPPSGILEVLHNLILSVVDNPLRLTTSVSWLGVSSVALLCTALLIPRKS